MSAQAGPSAERSSRHAWAEPGVSQVLPGVHRVPLPLPDAGLHAVNAYVLMDGDGPVLVDPGQATEQTEPVLLDALRALDVDPADVARVLVTHVHRDHYSQAVLLRARHGTRIGLGEGERRSLALVRDVTNDRLVTQLTLLRRSGAADLARALAGGEDGVDPELWQDPDEWLVGGQQIELADRTLTAVATPGHTRGHLVFRDEAAGFLLAGDHVLPAITPSIGFEPDPTSHPLADYLTSLLRVRALGDTMLLPAHGPVTGSVHARVDELLEHHAQRLDDTRVGLTALRAERVTGTAADVAARLRWTRRLRRLDELSPIDRMLAVLETRAHLDVLVIRGRCTAYTDEGGVDHYEPA